MADATKLAMIDWDSGVGASYVELTTAVVAYTLEIDEAGEGFMADYDETGAVRGLEFLTRPQHPMTYYRALADRHSRGPGWCGPRV